MGAEVTILVDRTRERADRAGAGGARVQRQGSSHVKKVDNRFEREVRAGPLEREIRRGIKRAEGRRHRGDEPDLADDRGREAQAVRLDGKAAAKKDWAKERRRGLRRRRRAGAESPPRVGRPRAARAELAARGPSRAKARPAARRQRQGRGGMPPCRWSRTSPQEDASRCSDRHRGREERDPQEGRLDRRRDRADDSRCRADEQRRWRRSAAVAAVAAVLAAAAAWRPGGGRRRVGPVRSRPGNGSSRQQADRQAGRRDQDVRDGARRGGGGLLGRREPRRRR